MNLPKHRPAPARIFLREWMAVRNIADQKHLATLMGRAEGTVSKKLNNPDNVDLRWIGEFAAALKIKPIDLFVDPASLSTPPPENRPRLDELLSVASEASDDQIGHLIGLLSPSRAAALQPEQNPVQPEKPTATMKSG